MADDSDGIDPQTLAAQYQQSDNLNTRIDFHARFSSNPYSLQRWLFDHYYFPRRSTILELGCGVGTLWKTNQDRLSPDWKVVLSDWSHGMVQAVRQTRAGMPDQRSHITVAQADAQILPFQDAVFDGVIANHMLYHLAAPEQALAEIQRVLRPGGKFYASTVGDDHMHELWEAIEPIAPGTHYRASRLTSGFTLSNGSPQLSPWFAQIALYTYEDSLMVTEAEALVDYLLSCQTMMDYEFSTEQIGQIHQLFQQTIDNDGAFYITKRSGLFSALRN
jgi:SAM-dependent methyltransferase